MILEHSSAYSLVLSHNRGSQIRQLEGFIQGHITNGCETMGEQYAEFKKTLKLETSKEKFEEHIVCFIDGDGYIFDQNYINGGDDGARDAVQKLRDEIKKDAEKRNPRASMERFTTFLFVNAAGLCKTMGISLVKFNKFLIGLNKADRRFMAIDVGYGKEAADSKLAAILEDTVQSPNTLLAYIGVEHDGGYAPMLNELKTKRHDKKIVILSGYVQEEEKAQSITRLGLSTIAINGLFRAEKLGKSESLSGRSRGNSLSEGITAGLETASLSSSFASSNFFDAISQHIEITDDGPSSFIQVSKVTRTSIKPKDQKDVMNKWTPCLDHYLNSSGCWRGESCRYSHELFMDDEQRRRFKEDFRGIPCKNALKDNVGKCKNFNFQVGSWCYYGHKCPNGPSCEYKRDNTCTFTARGMHD
ncbi:hypothetical protein C8Q75DRAFT_757583 [Abortiporus biennis]|nr:hypothetical protein C8Q75DRAFT_757583 [Abortiporus biennis]